MLLYELHGPEQWDKINKIMRKAGYTELGSGVDSTVWGKDEGRVIKILMPESGDLTPAEKVFLAYYETAQKYSDNPHMMKFVNIGGQHYTKFDINGETFYQIAVEKLQPLPDGSFEEAVVWAMSECVANRLDWPSAYQQLTNPKNKIWQYYEGDSEAVAKKIAGSKRTTLKYLYLTMQLMYHIGRKQGFGWDLHTENAMLRNDGTIVITDPWYSAMLDENFTQAVAEGKISVKLSPGKGNGLFATKPIKAGEVITRSKFVPIDDQDWNLIKNTTPVKLYGFKLGDQHALQPGPFKFQFKDPKEKALWNKTKFKDLSLSGFMFINGADSPDEVNSEEKFSGNSAEMIATRDIQPGEEIIKQYNVPTTDVAEGTLNEIYKMPPTKNSSQGLAAWAYHDAVEKNSKIIFQDSNTIVFQVGADMIRYIILSQGKPILYLGLTKFLDGWKSGVVAAELEARGQGLATKIYLQASDLLNQPIYSDTTQTDASRLGIWNKLIQMVPGRVVGFDQKTNNDLPITMTKDGPVVNQNQPLYIDRNKKDSEKPVTQQQRYRTRILKLLPNKQGVAEQKISEINAADELTVPDELVQRFTTAGWQIVGEGRDQIVLGKPNSRYVLKIVGQGSGSRIDQVRRYIDFYRQNQQNPHWPRVGGDRLLKWGNKTYYAYTQEKLQHLPGDEAVLDYLEYAMEEISRGREPDFAKIPQGLSARDIDGLINAVDALFAAGIGDQYQFDLSNVYNIMQRDNGQLVIVDPFAGWDEDEALDEGKVKLYTDPSYFGAEVDDTGFDSLPVVNIPTNQLVGFEPDIKMQEPKAKANVKKILAGLEKGDNIPPILVRKYKTGYQVLDGHHRFWAYKVAKKDSIPARVVDPKDIEEVGKQGVADN